MAPLQRAAAAPSDHQGAQMLQPDQATAQMIQHFTHPHPLQHVQLSQEFKCNGCNVIGLGPRYNCASCDFHLHEQCARCPFTLHSPHLHPRHQLTLVNVPGKSHFCDLCGAIADGMFYTCKDCDIDVHPLCSQLPLQVQHAFHPQHPLMLQPGHPSSCCNVCGQGCGTWRYQCNECNHVDVHLKCVARPQQVQGGHLSTTPKWVPQQGAGVAHPSGGGSGNIETSRPVSNYPQTNLSGGGGNYGTNQPVTNYQTIQAVGHPSGGGGNYDMNQRATNYRMPQVVGRPSGGTNQPVINYHATQAVVQPSGGGDNYGAYQPVTNYQTTQTAGYSSGGGGNYGMSQQVTNYKTVPTVGYVDGAVGYYVNSQLATNYPPTQTVGYVGGGVDANYVNSQVATIPVGYSGGGAASNIGNNQVLVPVYQTQGSGNGRKNSGGQLASKLGKFAVNVVSTSIIGVPLITTQKNRVI